MDVEPERRQPIAMQCLYNQRLRDRILRIDCSVQRNGQASTPADQVDLADPFRGRHCRRSEQSDSSAAEADWCRIWQPVCCR